MPIGHPLGFKQHPLEDAGLYEGQAINLHESTVNRCVFFSDPRYTACTSLYPSLGLVARLVDNDSPVKITPPSLKNKGGYIRSILVYQYLDVWLEGSGWINGDRINGLFHPNIPYSLDIQIPSQKVF